MSLPVSMKRIPSRTTEKKRQHRFSNYNTICCHGNQWSDLAEFRTHPSFYALDQNLMQSIPHPNDASDALVTIGPLVAEIFEFENVYGRTHARTDARTPDRPVYYKLTFEPSAHVSEKYSIRQTHQLTQTMTHRKAAARSSCGRCAIAAR